MAASSAAESEPAVEPYVHSTLVMPSHTNTLGVMHGGWMMSWMDMAAWVVAARAVAADHLVRDGGARARQLHHVALGGFHRLAHRLAHLVRLAGRDADLTFPVPHRNQGIEGETATALHDFGDPADVNHLFFQF